MTVKQAIEKALKDLKALIHGDRVAGDGHDLLHQRLAQVVAELEAARDGE
jgi:hypothetical protein